VVPGNDLKIIEGVGGINDPDYPDYRVLLNNLLQGHHTGNLASHFQYAMTREGPDDLVTYLASAKCEHVPLSEMPDCLTD